MPDARSQLGCPVESAGRGERPLEKQLLALDALSKLTKHFCDKPDFERLIEVLLMTLCGQFAVSESFALLRKPSSQTLSQSFFATGRFRKNVLLASLQVSWVDWPGGLDSRSVMRVEEFEPQDDPMSLAAVLRRVGVHVVFPLVHNARFFGLIGMGVRVTGKAYSREDLDLLDTIVSTVTPLVANSYLFWDLANINKWYLDILNNVRQGVFVFDRGGRLKKINSAGIDILKTFMPGDLDLSDLEDTPIEAVFPEPIFDGWAKHFMEAREARHRAAVNSVVARAAGNERIYNVRISGSAEHAEIGTALIVTLDDVTSQKESEQRLFDLQKFADTGFMAASIAHELNNFLALILGGVELIEFALESGETGKAWQTLEKLKKNLANMERFTRGLTDFTGTETNKEVANLNSIIADVLSFLSVQKRFKQVRIEQDLDGALPAFEMDSDRITQLLLNLLNNAADAVKQAHRDDARIIIRTCRDEDQAVLMVSDNGVGIEPQTEGKLFKSRLTTKKGGHGYGLITCAGIIADHQGTVDFTSEVGAGTAFTIRFPLHPDQ